MFVTCGMTWIWMALLGQVAASRPAENWLAVYSGAVRLELGEGDLAEAAAAYRRVLVSKAPESYKQAAKYRLAGVLGRLGKVAEKKAILESLQKELNGKELPASMPVVAAPAVVKAAGGISDSSGAPRGALRGAPGRSESLGGALGAQVARELAELAAAEGAREADNGPLRQAIAAGDSGLIREAARALAIADGPEGMRVLLAAYKAEPDGSMVKGVLLESLGEAGWPAVVEEIREALDGKNAGAAAIAVGLIGDGESAQRLVGLLGHADAEVRRQAARGLRMLRYVPAVERLIEVAGEDPEGEVRAAAVDALQAIGTARAVAAVASQPVRDPAVVFPLWYRTARLPAPVVQKEFRPIGAIDATKPPRVGVVVSAMTHHAPPYERMPVPYLRQIRKAWVLQRAGFEVCLLAEPEVLIDPAGKDLGELFEPPIEMHGLGQWPACDAVVVDQVHHLPAEAAQTILGYCRNGGKVVTCSAPGGSWCGDEVAWRGVVGVRFPHAHAFRDEAVVLSWQERQQTRRQGEEETRSNNHNNDSRRLPQIGADNNNSYGNDNKGPAEAGTHTRSGGSCSLNDSMVTNDVTMAPANEGTAQAEAWTPNKGSAERAAANMGEWPTVSWGDWAAHRGGTFYSHDVLGGRVLAVLQTPAIWAIKVQEVGRGRVLCINWNIGMNADGAWDEDQLFCRCVDVVLGPVGQRGAARYAMMRYVRWGRLAEAKECVKGCFENSGTGGQAPRLRSGSATASGTPESQRSEVRSQRSEEGTTRSTVSRRDDTAVPPSDRGTRAANGILERRFLKQSLGGERLPGLGNDERIETLVQLYRVHRLENNEAAGEVMCRRLLRDSGSAREAEKVLTAAMRPWPRLQMTSSIGGEIFWWRDVPEWLGTPRGVPLWLAGPAAVPATVRVRVGLVGQKDGEEGGLRVMVEGARIAAVRDAPAVVKVEQTSKMCRMQWSGSEGVSADLEIVLERMNGRVTCGE